MSTAAVHLAHLCDVPEHPAHGDVFTAYGVLRSARPGTTRNGRPFVDVEICDATATWAGKIWDEAVRAREQATTLRPGTPVKIQFAVDRYRDSAYLTVQRLRAVGDEDDVSMEALFGPGVEQVGPLACETLVFDIETIPNTDLRKVPPTIAQAVTKHADRSESEEAKVMGLSPWFGQVVSLAFGDGSLPDGQMPVRALVVPPERSDTSAYPEWMIPVSEPELLEAFWFLAGQAREVVTYNGRGFDVPYLVARSLVHGIPVRVDLLSRRDQRHLDLLPLVGRAGAFRAQGPASLDVVCWALNITSPKGDMDGSMVAPTYAQGDIQRIAEYNVGDVEATARIYRRAASLLLPFQRG